jgi:hypothetical protein
VVVYGGDVEKMLETATYMTFLEELVHSYDFTWGRTSARLEDFAKKYHCSIPTLKKAVLYRLRIELECRKRWPMYAFYDEDAKFRDSK